ncbi:MAG: Na/Pi cotransporter family protein [Bacteroidales bacterium]|jgi:phosphate:Na+ symporter|nr:Na/Pi cotransporter family protein [Bacteroidales bacterium]
MGYGFIDFLTLLGSLGIFLYGMKLMSEALQKVAGNGMREILSKMTSNRIKGVFTGFLITAIIQSSSATTVMMVSFVNAGLLSLTQSIGIIMGANIGTTVTAWLISILGFKVKLSAFALPLIGIALPLLFSKINKRKYVGEIIIGFALLFMGLGFLKEAVPDINSNPEILSFLSGYTEMGYWSYFLFLGIGTLLTIIIQSSSATMALTLVMCTNGWISFDIAAAMVLGENIGTAVTANIAAAVANVSAKRSARAHLIFNVLGVTWVLLIFPFFIQGISWFISLIGGTNPNESVAGIPIALSIFHTTFNILNTIIFFGFAMLIVKIVTKLVPQKDDGEEFRLAFIDTGVLSTSELSIHQAKKEIIVFAERTHKMFDYVKILFEENNDKKFYRQYERIEKYEGICDRMEIEIASYLTKVAEGQLSPLASKRIKAMFKIISDIESIGDSNFNLAKTLYRKKDNKTWFDQDIRTKIEDMFKLIDKSFEEALVNLDAGYSDIDISKAIAQENTINHYRDRLKREHIANVKEKKYNYQTGVIFTDLFSECEKLGDYLINLSQAINDINK